MTETDKQYVPLVSVIIPCYNGERYLAEALDSISTQSYTNWECIIADDGSTDRTKEIALSYSSNDTRFKYISQINSGPSAARNLGIKIAQGDFFQFLDTDDLIESEKIKQQVYTFKQFPSADLVYGEMKYFTKTGTGQIKVKENEEKYWKNGKISGQGDDIIKVLLHGNIMVVDSPLIRRNVFDKIGMWDEQIWFNEDWDVWTRCALAGLSFRFDGTQNTCALVRFHEESRSRDLYKMFVHGLKVCLKINRVIKQWKYKRIITIKIYRHIQFLDKQILTKYKVEKSLSVTMASDIYRETRLYHFCIFTWLIKYTPYFFCLIYSKIIYLVIRIISKIKYES